MEFRNPLLLILLPIVLGLLWFWIRSQKQGALPFSSLKAMSDLDSTWKIRFGWLPFVMRVLAIASLCIAVAGPRKVLEESKVNTEGIDIVLALDCSGSMAAEDFMINGERRNRFEIIKKVVGDFIDMRGNDQISIIAFAGRAYTVCPLTTDHQWLKANLERLHLGIIEDGTAIGSGIASSLSRFKNSKAKSKVLILLTDGMNNAGNVEPLTAAKTAAAMGVKIYTIGAGSKGLIPYPVNIFGQKAYQTVQSDLDEESLSKIAQLTHARYFRATDTQGLKDIYKQIDQLEKTKIEQVGYKQYSELFWIFACACLVLLLGELLLTNTFFFKIP